MLVWEVHGALTRTRLSGMPLTDLSSHDNWHPSLMKAGKWPTRTNYNIAKMASRIYRAQTTPSQEKHTVATTKEIHYCEKGMHGDLITVDK